MSSLDGLRDVHGKFLSYTNLGGYPLYYIALPEQRVYCPDCANQEDADPPITDGEVNWEDPDLYCDGCSTRIESAYAEEGEYDPSWEGQLG